MIAVSVNGVTHQLDIPSDTALLWVLRDALGLTGTVYGCGAGRCGACTVHIDGEPQRSCQVRAADLAGRPVTSIEGVDADPEHPVHRAVAAGLVPPATECRCGQTMRAAALLARVDDPVAAAEALAADPCRCDPLSRLRARLRNRAAADRGCSADGTNR